MPPEEQILVIERRIFDRVGAFEGLIFDTQRYLDTFFASGVPRFMPRAKAETDPTHKQLIPYVLIEHGGKILSYVRGKRAGETRLVGQRSIGIGGHINPIDDAAPLFDADFRDMYRTAVEREVNEELKIGGGHTDQVVALLNDDSTEVGRVHLGIVHVWRLEAPRVEKREQMITQLAFLDPTELRTMAGELESWSRFCLDQLDEILARARTSPTAGSAIGSR